MAAFSTVVILIVVIALLFIALAKLGESAHHKTTEKFYDKYNPALLPGDKIQIYQGVQMPDQLPASPIQFDQNDPSAPTVDGSIGGPKSLYMLTYNEVRPECCDYSPYSSQGGCVCLTKDQMKYVGSRGKNTSVCA